MAVLVEAISVIIPVTAIHQKYPGGWEAFKRIIPNQTMCADNELVRVGFMTPDDVEAFVSRLQKAGLEFLKDGEAIDIAVADQMRGLTSKCRWAEFGRINLGGRQNQEVGACRLVGSKLMQVVTPPDWKFEGSLSQTFAFVPTEHAQKGMKFLRHENGLDVYLNPITGKEMYVGRTGQ
jgi:hypothetical protein